MGIRVNEVRKIKGCCCCGSLYLLDQTIRSGFWVNTSNQQALWNDFQSVYISLTSVLVRYWDFVGRPNCSAYREVGFAVRFYFFELLLSLAAFYSRLKTRKSILRRCPTLCLERLFRVLLVCPSKCLLLCILHVELSGYRIPILINRRPCEYRNLVHFC